MVFETAPPGGMDCHHAAGGRRISLCADLSVVQIQRNDLRELDIGVAHMDLLGSRRSAPGGGERYVAEHDPLFRLGLVHRFRAAVHALEDAAGGEQPHAFTPGNLIVFNDIPHSNLTPFAVLRIIAYFWPVCK